MPQIKKSPEEKKKPVMISLNDIQIKILKDFDVRTGSLSAAVAELVYRIKTGKIKP